MNMVTYYYTKYWESSGIQIVKSSDEPDPKGTILVKSDLVGCYSYCITLNKDAFLTVKEARADVVKRQARAIKSLEKKILKVKAINPFKMPVK